MILSWFAFFEDGGDEWRGSIAFAQHSLAFSWARWVGKEDVADVGEVDHMFQLTASEPALAEQAAVFMLFEEHAG